MRLLVIVSVLCLSSSTFAVKVKSITNEITQKNTDLLKYNPNDEYTLPEGIDEDDNKEPVNFQGNVMRAKTYKIENKNHGKGKFKYSLQTENGIDSTQVGKLKDDKTFIISGAYSYTGGDGRRYRVRYTADEFGYHPITELDVEIPVEDIENGFQFLKRRINDNKANRGSGQLLDNYSGFGNPNANAKPNPNTNLNSERGRETEITSPDEGYRYDVPADSYLPPLFK